MIAKEAAIRCCKLIDDKKEIIVCEFYYSYYLLFI